MTEMQEIKTDDKILRIYPADAKNSPVVYSNDYEENGAGILMRCAELSCPAFSLVTISGLDWDADMSPWPSEPVVYKDDGFSGKGSSQLRWILDRAVPSVQKILQSDDHTSYIAGYSMAGLFALWSLYETGFFKGAACISGSLWYPGFDDFAFKNEPGSRLHGIYISIGDRESKGRNRILRKNETVCRRLAEYYNAKGIRSVFELNSGNHFTDVDIRTARGIKWLLEQGKAD